MSGDDPLVARLCGALDAAGLGWDLDGAELRVDPRAAPAAEAVATEVGFRRIGGRLGTDQLLAYAPERGTWTSLKLRTAASGSWPGLRRRSTGCSVALLAPDGAGKSTLAATLRERVPVPTRLAYMGLYPQGERRLPPGLGLARRLLRVWHGYLRGRVVRARGGLAIYDRYTYDAMLGAGSGSTSRRLRHWLLARAVPAPDLVVYLDVPADQLHRRKAERDVATLERDRGAYLELAEQMPLVQVVDASSDPETVARAVMALVWDSWAAQLRPRTP